MKRAIKWALIFGGGLVVLVIAALLIIPMFVDVQEYKPMIEKKVSEATGRPFTLGGDLGLSLFPWAGLSFSDLHLGNPAGFKEKDFVSIKSFEVRVKLLPLLSKDIQVNRFIMDGPRIVLERLKDGRKNWEGLGKPSGMPSKAPVAPKGKPQGALPIKTLTVGEFAITNGFVLWTDRVKGESKEISDMNLRLKDVSLDHPIRIALSAVLDGKPVSLEGKMGPLGKEPGKGTIPVDIAIKALEQLNMSVKGKVTDPVTTPGFDMDIQISPFSPRKVMTALEKPFPIKTADPKALDQVALKAKVKGDPKNIAVSDGTFDLDESKLTFSMKAKDFSRPDVTFDLNLDSIDVDRYLPPPAEGKKPSEASEKSQASVTERKKIDYTPLRGLIMDGNIRVGKLKAHGTTVQDVHMKVSAKGGLINLDPFTLNLYQGKMSAKGLLDVRKDIPANSMELRAEGIQVGPLLKDSLKKEFLEGTTKVELAVRMRGDDPDRIKRTLNGKGDFVFNDGAIVGIDLAGMVRNIKATFGLAKKGGERPRTDFAELHSPFTITNGVVDTPGTSLMSPLLRVLAVGKANLVKKTLDFRVEPKFVATIKGQGDTKTRSGLKVPVLVTGTFSSPKFRPDLKGMFKEGLTDPSKLKGLLGVPNKEKGGSQKIEEKTKDLLKGLPFGQ